MKNSLLIFAAVLLTLTNATSQNNEMAAVETLYENYGYGASLEVFQQTKETEGVSADLLIKVADSYRLTGDMANAEYWYSQTVTERSPAIDQLHYAQVLMSNEQYDAAKEWFLNYQSVTEETNRLGSTLAEACENAASLKNNKDIQIENVKALNTSKLDFSPMYYKEGLVFTSTRGIQTQLTKNVDAWINDNFMDLFYAAPSTKKEFSNPKPFLGDINSKFHDGTATFNKAGTVMYFARNNYNNGKRRANNKGVTLLKIYSARLTDDGMWEDTQELPFNSDEFTSCHPTLSADGRKLYFASDRPGGMGGLDIYVSEMKGGQWSEPTNLGSNVNSEGNEIFPFMHEDGSLYFASNGHQGLGGLDIYSVTPTEKTGNEAYTAAANIGKPFNSSMDDFGFILDLTGTNGFFTSNREGGMGGDDIYSFTAPKNKVAPAMINKGGKSLVAPKICVYDAITNEKISNARVLIRANEEASITSLEDDYVLTLEPSTADGSEFNLNISKRGESTGSTNADLLTNKEGYISYPMAANGSYVFEIIAEGYAVTTEIVDLKSLSEGEIEFCIPVQKNNCISLKGDVINKNYKNNIPNASVKMLNKCTGEVFETVSDRDGKFEICLECGCDYALIGMKDFFINGNNVISTRNVDCENTELRVELALTPQEGEFGSFFAQNGNPTPQNGYGNPANNPTQSAPRTEQTYDPFQTGTAYREGMVIELKKIYYDFDQSYIRSEASVELDKLVALLNKYPTMEIELSSHTDSRGSATYNAGLSQRRADEAVAYLIQNGIIASRVSAKGYGEVMLRNKCKDGLACSESDHQANRRTEVKITKFSAQNVEVKYQDNLPEVIDSAPLSMRGAF